MWVPLWECMSPCCRTRELLNPSQFQTADCRTEIWSENQRKRSPRLHEWFWNATTRTLTRTPVRTLRFSETFSVRSLSPFRHMRRGSGNMAVYAHEDVRGSSASATDWTLTVKEESYSITSDMSIINNHPDHCSWAQIRSSVSAADSMYRTHRTEQRGERSFRETAAMFVSARTNNKKVYSAAIRNKKKRRSFTTTTWKL